MPKHERLTDRDFNKYSYDLQANQQQIWLPVDTY